MSSSSAAALPPTCRALRQKVYGEAPVVEEIRTPQAVPGTAVVKIEMAAIATFMKRIYDGTLQYPYPTPLTLGGSALGHIAALPVDSTQLRVGQLVLVDCVVRSRDQPAADVFLANIHSGYTDGSRKLMADAWKDVGTFAEYAGVPLENCTAIDEERMLGGKESGGLGYQVEDLAMLFKMLVPWGGLRSVGVTAGETVIVAPATGGFSGAAVKMALAMGAGKVVAMGRNEAALERVVAESGGRVVGVRITGSFEEDLAGLVAACGKTGEADVFFDISPPSAWESSHLKAAIYALRPGGRVGLMGGQCEDVKFPYSRIMTRNIKLFGKWMYDQSDIRALIQMAESGILKLRGGEGTGCKGVFGLDQWQEGSSVAESEGGKGTVLVKP
ncbi:hypothetical protein DV737_g5316, partial [Chaetothyriales sp. CBS 132003]